MNRLSTLVLSSALLAAALPAGAAALRYEVTSTAQLSLLPVVHDPVADLFGIARGSTTNVPIALRLVVESTSTPFVQNDNSVAQQVTYRDAVTSGEVEINGVVFATQRMPQPATGPAPSTGDESEIGFFNRFDPSLFDIVELGLRTSPVALDLFNAYTVPFNQTFSGTFYENATVQVSLAGVLMTGADLLDGVALPQTTGALENAASFSFNVQLPVTFDGGPQALVSLGAIGGAGGYTLSVTPVPLPAAVWCLMPALGVLGVRVRRGRTCVRRSGRVGLASVTR